MAAPMRNIPQLMAGVGRTRGPAANRAIQRKLRASSAVSNTAGMTVEKEIVQSR